MYADYVQSFLKNYREFNPLVSHGSRIQKLFLN